MQSEPRGRETNNGFRNIDSLFSRLLDTLPAAAYTCHADGLITYFNQHAVNVWGRAPKLNDASDRFCGSFKLFSTDGSPIAHDQCWMALALKTGREHNGCEIIIEQPSGRRITALAHANPIHDESGKLLGAVNVLVDISDRKSADEAQALLAAIVDSSDDAIVSKTLEGRVLSWNSGAERIFGYQAEEMVGSLITRIIPDDRQHEERMILTRLSRGERIEHYETVRRTKDGRLIDVSLTVSPVRDSSGRIIAASKVARDITARKESDRALVALKDKLAEQYAELQEADRRKDEFLAVLAHELRSPLAPICNSLHLLRLSEDVAPVVEHVRPIMERQVNNMVRLVDDLLEISRISRGKIELRKEPVDLLTVIGSAVETVRPLMEAGGHQLAVSLSPKPILLEADPVRIAQVISNLLNNAAKYTPTGGQVWLSAHSEGGQAAISVRDTGVGIPEDMLGHIFDMFAQIERARTDTQGGLGIGLTLAKRLVEMHGGAIEAHSTGLGQGSELIVRLPVMRTVAETPSRRPYLGKPALPSRRILVVDDEVTSAWTLGKLLEAIGQKVSVVHDAAAALVKARQERPEVIISDIGMPLTDGYELARSLRQEPELAGTLLVALTGYGRDSDKRCAKQAGFDRHLVKPVRLDSLYEMLAALAPSTANGVDDAQPSSSVEQQA